MKMKVIINGKEYMSPEIEGDPAEISDQHFNNTDKAEGFRMKLDTGAYLVLGSRATSQAVFLYF